jgi:hypothetical protein
MTGMTYIYFDRAISQTQFQFAYSMTDIAYDDAILVCDAKQASSSDLLAHFVSINGYMLLNVNQLNVNFLSALSANMGTITAGSITSALYRSGTGTKRIEINYGIANEIEFFEDGISKVRIGSDVFGDGLPGVYAAGNIVATDVLATLMDLSVGDDNAYTGRIILNNATNGYTIVLTAPDTTDSTKTITLPNASGTVSLTSHNHSGVYLGIHGQADSALDSDALEGYPASSFAFASHNHSGVYHPYVAGGFSGSGAYMNFTFSNGVCTFAS